MHTSKVSFILLSGVLLSILNLLCYFILPRLGLYNTILNWAVIYALEFGFYCLALYLYRVWVSKVLWFIEGFTVLILLTLVKIVLTSLLLFVIFTFSNAFLNPGISNLIGLLGFYTRGFLFELALLSIAAKIFETDIFAKPQDKNDHIIDNL